LTNDPVETGPAVPEKEVYKLTRVDDSNLRPPELPPPVRQERTGGQPPGENIISSTIRISESVKNPVRDPGTGTHVSPIGVTTTGGTGPFIPGVPAVPVVRIAQAPVVHSFTPDQKDPEFPGGPDALRTFMRDHLVTPGELDPGQLITVHIRFTVGIDGRVTDLEIVKSGGFLYDNEVIRVCRKMPDWKPARQNGIHVAVRYVLPVTFMGIEQ
jgi:protein TonB